VGRMQPEQCATRGDVGPRLQRIEANAPLQVQVVATGIDVVGLVGSLLGARDRLPRIRFAGATRRDRCSHDRGDDVHAVGLHDAHPPPQKSMPLSWNGGVHWPQLPSQGLIGGATLPNTASMSSVQPFGIAPIIVELLYEPMLV